MDKLPYTSPTLEVFKFKVERGFADSNSSTPIDCFIGDVSNENVTEGEHSKIFDEDVWY